MLSSSVLHPKYFLAASPRQGAAARTSKRREVPTCLCAQVGPTALSAPRAAARFGAERPLDNPVPCAPLPALGAGPSGSSGSVETAALSEVAGTDPQHPPARETHSDGSASPSRGPQSPPSPASLASASGAGAGAGAPSTGQVRRSSAPSDGASASSSGGPPPRAVGRGLYTKFVQHCFLRMSQRMPLRGYHVQEKWRLLQGQDGSSGTPALCRSTAACAPKIRFVRSADISAGNNLQVLNLVAFPSPQYSLPYFCADLVTFPRGHLIVIDMNPLFQREEYLDHHIRRTVTPICNKFAPLLPWGGEFTAESLQFFSPALLWSRLPLDQDVANGPVFQAFCEYLEAWLDMVEECEEETDPAKIAEISEAQHRYMCWRAEKDPGRPVLTRLFGSEKCEDYIHNFLFDGLYSLGDKDFLDYFPQYRLPDGSICKKRSMAGKAYTARPWDEQGRLITDPEE